MRGGWGERGRERGREGEREGGREGGVNGPAFFPSEVIVLDSRHQPLI